MRSWGTGASATTGKVTAQGLGLLRAAIIDRRISPQEDLLCYMEENWLNCSDNVKAKWSLRLRTGRKLKEVSVFCVERFTLIHSFLKTTAVKNDNKYLSYLLILSSLTLLFR